MVLLLPLITTAFLIVPTVSVQFSPISIVSPSCAALIAASSVSYFVSPIFAVNVSAGAGAGVLPFSELPAPPCSPPVSAELPSPSLPEAPVCTSLPPTDVPVLSPSLPAIGFASPVSLAAAFAPVSTVSWLSPVSFTTFSMPLSDAPGTGVPSVVVSVVVSSAAPSSAASAVTGSIVSIIRPARVPARKRLFLLFMQKPPLRAYRRKGGDFLLFGNRLSCGKVRLDPVALRHRLSPAVPFSVQTRPRRIMHRSSCLS